MSLKRNQLLNVILFIYVLISITVLYFDLGNTKVGLAFSTLVAKAVPSVLPTAAITQTPESSALILSFSWLLVVLSTLAMILIANWKAIDYEAIYKRISWWVILGMYVGVPFLMASMMYFAPDSSGISNKFLSTNLKESKFFVILYGAGLWLSIAAGCFSIVLISVCIFKKFSKKGNL